MKIDKIIASLVLITVVIMAGGIFLVARFSSAGNIEPNEMVKAVASASAYDWGEIMMDEGNVEASFEITNEGSEALVLSDVVTSCMCTTASLEKGGEVSPEFGMHTKSGYKMSVAPGESANLKVVFDPAYHGPSGVGLITRQIKVNTNDPDNSTLSFMLTANVAK